jgi:NDP-sugar pyrophosphorylase family protein
MNKIRAGILGAGLGSRLKTNAGAKPLAPVSGGKSLLEILLARFRAAGVREIVCALRAEQITKDLRSTLPRAPGLSYLFADTESSLHTLAELVRKLEPARGAVLFSMADTVMLPADFSRFVKVCEGLPEGENAVLVTPFVDDEKPLWVDVDAVGLVKRFGSEKGAFVTSGMYFLSPAAMELALREVAEGTHKMRNFLSKLAESGARVRAHVVTKTIDVDHPSDLEKAAQFLLETQGNST